MRCLLKRTRHYAHASGGIASTTSFSIMNIVDGKWNPATFIMQKLCQPFLKYKVLISGNKFLLYF